MRYGLNKEGRLQVKCIPELQPRYMLSLDLNHFRARWFQGQRQHTLALKELIFAPRSIGLHGGQKLVPQLIHTKLQQAAPCPGVGH